QQGTVYQNGAFVPNALVMNWVFGMGYPLTEPYWIQVSVSGQQRWVLMQAFQRRILTYSPWNPDPWKVEMGNVGITYYNWRYLQGGKPVPTSIPAPTATPTPRPAAYLVVQPPSGNANTTITVTGYNFPAYSSVTVAIVKPSANY